MTYLIRLTYPERHEVYFTVKSRLRDCRTELRAFRDSNSRTCRADIFLLSRDTWCPAQSADGRNSDSLAATFVNYNFNCMPGYELEPLNTDRQPLDDIIQTTFAVEGDAAPLTRSFAYVGSPEAELAELEGEELDEE